MLYQLTKSCNIRPAIDPKQKKKKTELYLIFNLIMQSPTDHHFTAVKRIFPYLKGTPLHLVFS